MPPVHSKPALKPNEQLHQTNPMLFKILKERADEESRVGMALRAIMRSPLRAPEQPSHMVFVKKPMHNPNTSEVQIIVPAPGGEGYLLIRVPSHALHRWGSSDYQPEMLCDNLQNVTRRIALSMWETLTVDDQQEILLAAMVPLSINFLKNPQGFHHEVKPTLHEALGLNDRHNIGASYSSKHTSKLFSREGKTFGNGKAALQDKLDKLVKEVNAVSSALANFSINQDAEVDGDSTISGSQDTSDDVEFSTWGKQGIKVRPINSNFDTTDTGIWGGNTKYAHPIMTPTTSDSYWGPPWGTSPRGTSFDTNTLTAMSSARGGNPKDPFVDSGIRVMPGNWVDEPQDDDLIVDKSQATIGKGKGKQATSWLFGRQSSVGPEIRRTDAKEERRFTRSPHRWTDPSGATHWVSNPYIPPRARSIHKNRVSWGDLPVDQSTPCRGNRDSSLDGW